MQFCAAIAVCSWPFERTKTLKDYVCKHNFEIHCILLPPISVRISGGKANENTTAGKVEMFHHGNWVTMCADDFDDRDAKVVCKELGFPNSKALVPGTFLRFELATGFKMSTRTTLFHFFLVLWDHGLFVVLKGFNFAHVLVGGIGAGSVNTIDEQLHYTETSIVFILATFLWISFFLR